MEERKNNSHSRKKRGGMVIFDVLKYVLKECVFIAHKITQVDKN